MYPLNLDRMRWFISFFRINIVLTLAPAIPRFRNKFTNAFWSGNTSGKPHFAKKHRLSKRFKGSRNNGILLDWDKNVMILFNKIKQKYSRAKRDKNDNQNYGHEVTIIFFFFFFTKLIRYPSLCWIRKTWICLIDRRQKSIGVLEKKDYLTY